MMLPAGQLHLHRQQELCQASSLERAVLVTQNSCIVNACIRARC